MNKVAVLALVLASATSAHAADNESFIDQIGTSNAATIAQENGNNTQGTLQVGKANIAITSQTGSAIPAASTDGSFIGQFGSKNEAVTSQTTADHTGNSFTNGHANARCGHAVWQRQQCDHEPGRDRRRS